MRVVKEGVESIRPGRNLFYRELHLGTGSEIATFNLVMLHGTCASSAQFDFLLCSLQEKDLSACCYLYDAVGCGRSPTLSDYAAYHTDEQVLDLKAIMDTRIDPSRPTILLGHSYAPTIIMRYLCQNDDSRVKACIFLSTAIIGGPLPITNGGHPLFGLPVPVLKCIQPWLTKEFLKMAFDPSADAALVEASRVASNKNSMCICKWYQKHHQFAILEEAKAVSHLPVLIMHGVSDGIIPKEGGQHLADSIGEYAAFKIIEMASHQVMEERPDEVAKEVMAFVQGLL